MRKPWKIILINLIIISVVLIISFHLGKWCPNQDGSYNWDIVSLIVNNVTVLDIFIITFILIDNKNIKKETNKEKIATQMLALTYKECNKYINFLTDEIVKNYIIKKCDFSKTVNKHDNIIYTNLENAPFTFENQILNFSNEGIINADNFNNFINLKQLYMDYIDKRLSFYDIPVLYTPLKNKLEKYIDEKLNQIKSSLIDS